MENNYCGAEVVQIGINIEKNGRDFYNTLISSTENNLAKIAFEYLAGEEEKHITFFTELLSKIENYAPEEAYGEEFFYYLDLLAREHVFTEENKGKEIAEKIKTPLEAIEMGIRFEKDSIALFEAIKNIIPPESRKLLDLLIAEEQKHLKKLLDLC